MTWAVEAQLQLPPEGIDYSLGGQIQFLPLCAFEFGPGRFIRVRWKVGSGTIFIDSLVGDEQWDLGEIYGLRLNRGDTIDLQLRRREGLMTFTVVAAGSLGSAPAEISLPVTHAVPPTRFQLGDEHHELISALVLRRISVETVARPGLTLVRPMGELAGAPNQAGSTGGGRRDRGEPAGTEATTDRAAQSLVFDILVRLGESARHRFDPHDADGDGMITFLDLRQLLLGSEERGAGRSRRR